MLLQTNSYIVPADRRAEHARMIRRFRQALSRIGCDQFEVYEQVGVNWSPGNTGRYVQIMRFRDRKHQLEVQSAERADGAAQQVVADFCELINYPYQQQQGLFAVGFYTSFLKMPPQRTALAQQPSDVAPPPGSDEAAAAPLDPAPSEPAAASMAEGQVLEGVAEEIDMNSDQDIPADGVTLVGGMVGQNQDNQPFNTDQLHLTPQSLDDPKAQPPHGTKPGSDGPGF